MQWVCFDKTCASYVFLDNVQLEFSMIGHSKPTSDGELKLFAPRNDLEHASEYLTNNKKAGLLLVIRPRIIPCDCWAVVWPIHPF